MIEKLAIENFQSHSNSFLEFDKGVNVIVGPSNHGKSSVIRSLRLLLENKPNGNAFIKKGAKKAVVGADFGDFRVEREKGKKNLYVLNDDIEDPYEGFGTKVPDDILEKFNMSEVNIQNQIDNFFLIQDKPSEIAKTLNEVVNLSIIDESVKEVNSTVRAAKKDWDNTSKEKESISDQLESEEYLKIDSAIKDYSRVENIEKTIDSLLDKKEDIEEVLMSYGSVLKEEDKTDYSSIEKDMQEIFVIDDEQESLEDEVDLYRKSIESLREVEGREVYDWKTIEKEFTMVCEWDDEIEELDDRAHEFRDSIEKLETALEFGTKIEKELLDLEKELEEVKPDTCPTCGKEW